GSLVSPLVVVRMDEAPVHALTGGFLVDLPREIAKLVVRQWRGVTRDLHARLVECFGVRVEREVGRPVLDHAVEVTLADLLAVPFVEVVRWCKTVDLEELAIGEVR